MEEKAIHAPRDMNGIPAMRYQAARHTVCVMRIRQARPACLRLRCLLPLFIASRHDAYACWRRPSSMIFFDTPRCRYHTAAALPFPSRPAFECSVPRYFQSAPPEPRLAECCAVRGER